MTRPDKHAARPRWQLPIQYLEHHFDHSRPAWSVWVNDQCVRVGGFNDEPGQEWWRPGPPHP